MRIAIIGTGKVGSALGAQWLRAGHEIVFGSSSPGRHSQGDALVTTPGRAPEGADVVVLALPGRVVADFITDAGDRLTGKIIVDAANRVGTRPMNSRAALQAGTTAIQYVRAFSNVGVENFADPPPGADLFFAADAAARHTAEQLIIDVGLRPVYVGGAEASDVVDGLLPLWFALTQQRGGDRHFAFRITD